MTLNETGVERILEHLGVRFTPRPSWQSINCPDPGHADRRASARLTLEGGGRIYCLGCGLSNSIPELFALLEEVDHETAVERCEEIAGAGNSQLRKAPRGGTSLSRGERNNGKRRLFKPPWLRS